MPSKFKLQNKIIPPRRRGTVKTMSAAPGCYNINWASWSNFTGTSATGTINDNGDVINVAMTSNFTFDSTPSIYNYARLSAYPDAIPDTTVPRTTWTIGAGGVTTMCFSKTVTNPVLLLASLGSSNGTQSKLTFSIPYVVVYDGGGMVYNDSHSLTGTEGYAVIMFPGDFDCVTINSSTYEYYTNITWGIKPQPFQVDVNEVSNNCSGVVLAATGGVSYKWDGGDTPNSATNTFHQSGTYVVTATNASGCTASVAKTIAISPTSGMVDISGDQSGCGSVTLTAGAGWTNYLWNGGDHPNSATNTFHQSGTYSVMVNNGPGCSANASATVTITTAVSPAVNISAMPAGPVCQGMPVTYTAVVQNGGATPQLNWYKNNIQVATGDSYIATDLSDNDKIICSLTSSANCSTPAVVTSNQITQSISPLPAITLNPQAFVVNNNAIRLTPEVSGNISSFLWTPASGLDDPTIKEPLANPITKTKYQLTVTSTTGCIAVADVTVNVSYNLIVPNTFTPNSDGVNDTWNITNLQYMNGVTVDIYNRWGRHLYHSVGYTMPWDGTYQGKPVPIGSYYYLINTSDKTTKPLVGYVLVVR